MRTEDMLTECSAVLEVAPAKHLRAGCRPLRRHGFPRRPKRLHQIAVSILVALSVCPRAESQRATLITSMNVGIRQDRLEVNIGADRALSMQAVFMGHPDRIVLDAAGALFKVDKLEIPIDTGPVKSVRIGLLQSRPPVTRIVVDTSAPLPFTLRTERNSVCLQIVLPSTAPTLAPGNPPSEPQITYEKGLLTIVAENSSLAEILNAVHSQTGGLTQFPAAAANERAAVKLGPAPLTSVLAALLLGSPFDYVIVGSAQEPNSFQIVLTEKSMYSESQRLSEVPAPLQNKALASNPAETVASDESESDQLSAGPQFMGGPSSVGASAGENLSGPENAELLPDTQPQKTRPSREGPRLPFPGKRQ